MSLAEDLNQIKPEKPTKMCSVQWTLNLMEDDEAEVFGRILTDDRAINMTTVSKVLRDHGYDVKPDALSRHRSGICRCSPMT